MFTVSDEVLDIISKKKYCPPSLEGEKDFHNRKDRGAHPKFWKEFLRGTKILFCRRGFQCFLPLRGTKILFCGRGFKCLSPLRGSNSKSPHYLLSYLFWFNTLTGTVKAPTVDLLTLNTLRETKTTF